MTRQRYVLKYATLAALAFGSVSAFAADGKSYPGMICVADGTRVPAGHSQGTPQVFDGTLSNRSTSEDLFVSCPFVHDQTNIGSGKMYAFDRTVDGEVSCTLRSETDTEVGRTVFVGVVQGTGLLNVQPNAIPRTFGAVSMGEYNYASCVIPKVSAIDGGVSHIAGFTITES